MTTELSSPRSSPRAVSLDTVDALWRLPLPALFLDVDGTLLDIAETPESVVVPPDLPGLLACVAQELSGALALVSGRSLLQLDGFFSPHRFAAAGQHGAELRRIGDGASTDGADALLDPVRQGCAGLEDAFPGVRIEDKGASFAVHYRQAPEAEPAVRRVLAELLAGRAELEMLPAKMAFDIKRRGLSKGTAVGQLMATAPFCGRVPVFVGDDVTDRFGMATAQRAGGFAVQVGEAPPDQGGIVEDFRLASPANVRAWLHGFVRGQALPLKGSVRQ